MRHSLTSPTHNNNNNNNNNNNFYIAQNTCEYDQMRIPSCFHVCFDGGLKKESLVRKQRKSLAAFDHNLPILALVAIYLNYGLDGETGVRNKKPHRMRF